MRGGLPTDTPWRRVFHKFKMNQSQFAKALGKDRSKISRALADEKGLINGRDQELIIKAAKANKVALPPDYLVPAVK